MMFVQVFHQGQHLWLEVTKLFGEVIHNKPGELGTVTPIGMVMEAKADEIIDAKLDFFSETESKDAFTGRFRKRVEVC